MSFKPIGDALDTQINELIGAWRLGNVYNYDVRVDDGIETPAVVIAPADWREVMLDTNNNECLIPYYIRVIDTATDDRANMEDNIRDLADAVMEKVKDMSDITYSNWYAYLKDYEFRWWRAQWAEPYRVFELQVNFICVETK